MAKETRGRKSAKDKILLNLELIKDMRRKGFTVGNIAEQIGISYKTLYKYAGEEPAIQLAIDTDKEVNQIAIEKSLLYNLTRPYDIVTKYAYVTYLEELHGDIEDYPDEEKKKVGPKWFIRIPVEETKKPNVPNAGLYNVILPTLDKKYKNNIELNINEDKDEKVESVYELINIIKTKSDGDSNG